jgi:hypothetical protein
MPLLGSLSIIKSIHLLSNFTRLCSRLLKLHCICLYDIAFACVCLRLRSAAARRCSQEIARKLNLNTE